MKADQCSVEAFDILVESGQFKTHNIAVFTLFKWTGRPMSAREVFEALNARGHKISQNVVRTCLTNLTDDCLLSKSDTIMDHGRRVNRWEMTGRTTPAPVESNFETCDKCHGRGKLYIKQPVDEKQGDFLVG